MILVLKSDFDDKIGWCHFCHPPCAPVSTWSNAPNHGSQTGNQAKGLIQRLNKGRQRRYQGATTKTNINTNTNISDRVHQTKAFNRGLHIKGTAARRVAQWWFCWWWTFEELLWFWWLCWSYNVADNGHDAPEKEPALNHGSETANTEHAFDLQIEDETNWTVNRIKRISSYSVDPYFADGVVAALLGIEEVERIIISQRW